MKAKVKKPDYNPYHRYHYVAHWNIAQDKDQLGNEVMLGGFKCEAVYDTYEEAEQRCLAESAKQPSFHKHWWIEEQYVERVPGYMHAPWETDTFSTRAWDRGQLVEESQRDD